MFALPDSQVSKTAWIEHLRKYAPSGGYRSSLEVAKAFASRPKLWRAMMVEGNFSKAELDAAEVEMRRECEKFHITVQD